MSNIPVSVVIPVKNEELNLPHCLAALQGRFDDVIIVDSNSSDRTPQIAADYGARLVNFTWDGQFPKKRNWYLDHHDTVYDWCLFLDADEVVSPEFCTALDAAVKTQDEVGFWLNYTNYFLGRPLHHGVPQRKLALFRKSAGRYERIDEDHWSNLDMEVHEHPQLTGPVGEIAARIDHRDFQGLGKFITRHLDYAKWEMTRYSKVMGTADFDRLTERQKTKYRHLGKAWFPAAYFLMSYVAKLGFLDGASGLQYSFYKAWYFNTIRLMIREQKRSKTAQNMDSPSA